jgi:hypothetical protein
VSHEHATCQDRQQIVRDFLEGRRYSNVVRGYPGQPHHRRRNGPSRVYQTIEHHLSPLALNQYDAHFKHPILSSGSGAGGFHVDNGEGDVLEPWRCAYLRRNSPAAVKKALDAGIRSKQGRNQPLHDGWRCANQAKYVTPQFGRGERPMTQQVERPVGDRRGGVLIQAAQGQENVSGW